MRLPSIPYDKSLHANYGALSAFVGVLIGLYLGVPAAACGYAANFAVAVGKEAYDRYTGSGEATPTDAAATVLGGIPVNAVAMLLG